MKTVKVITVFLAVLLLSGCARAYEQTHTGDMTTEATTVETSAETVATETTAAETTIPETTAVPVTATSASYEIIRDDRSAYDNETLLIEHYYDVVVLDSSLPSAAQINQKIRDAADAFFHDYGYSSEDLAFAKREGAYIPFCNYFEATVSHNDGGIIAIRHSGYWYMGGVGNSLVEGEVYDLKTGEKLTLQELLPGREEEIRSFVISFVNEKMGNDLLVKPEEALEEFAYSEIPFVIEGAQIILVFPVYTFAPGAAGPTFIPTGIYLEG